MQTHSDLVCLKNLNHYHEGWKQNLTCFRFPALYVFVDVKPNSSKFSADFWGLLFLCVLQVLRPAAPLFSPSVQHLSVCVNTTHHDEEVGAPEEEKDEEKSSLELCLRLSSLFS